MQAENSCSSPGIESLFGAKGFSRLCKSVFTGGWSASMLKTQATHTEAAIRTGTYTRFMQGDL